MDYEDEMIYTIYNGFFREKEVKNKEGEKISNILLSPRD
jgi:hypothetical protein